MATTPRSADIPENEHLWRKLGQAKRDLKEIPHEKQREIALIIYRDNGLAKRFAEIITDFTAGDEPTVEAGDENLQAVLDTFWDDCVNSMREFARELAGQLRILGEQFVQVFVRETDGRLQLGYIDPDGVQAVVPMPGNPRDLREVHLKVPPGSPPIILRIIRPNEDLHEVYSGVTDEGKRGPGAFRLHPRDPALVGKRNQIGQFTTRKPDYDGATFFFHVNKLSNATRGISDLFAVADYLDGLDKTTFNAVERSFMLNLCQLDVTIEGATAGNLKEHEKIAKAAWSNPGGVYTHNEKTTAETVTADLKSADMRELILIVKLMILGSWGFPLHWFADGGEANLATAGEMGGPTIRKLQSAQTVVRQMLRSMADFQVALKAALAPEELSGVERMDGYEIMLPAITSKDTAREATAFAQTFAGLLQAYDEGLITKLDMAVITQKQIASLTDHEYSDLNPALLEQIRLLSEAEIEGMEVEDEPPDEMRPGDDGLEPDDDEEAFVDEQGKPLPPALKKNADAMADEGDAA